ncbi:MAG: methionine--tRNA ligase subunit beta, partial [Acidobacteriota bacterium]|nr:methionine--tRNA ligase subunit beta [Acidobacteriota bacterium]
QLRWGGLIEGTRIGEVAPVFPRIDKVKAMAEIEMEIKETKATNEQQHTEARATQADAVPGATTAAETAPPQPPQRGATEADAVPASMVASTPATSDPATQSSGASPSGQGESGQADAASSVEGVVNLINIDDFAKVEMRVGEILTAERVPKADKLLRFTIDLGEATPRQVLAGIAQYYEPEQLIGRKIIVVANLQPRKLRGFESHGMVLAASVGDEGRPVLATFTEDVPNGARLR